LDETSIDHTTQFDGNGDISYGLFTPISRGQKLIIVVNAGDEQGCVPNTYMDFSTRDYHSVVNIENMKNVGRKMNPKSFRSLSGFTGPVYSGHSEYKFW
jgi:hypothetical protein